MTKQERQFTIKEIIAARPVASQDELRQELRRRGCKVTQATLSRDLQELGVMRVPSDMGMRYALQPLSEMRVLRPLVGAEVLAIVASECLVVVKTLPGAASTVGEYVDMDNSPDIIGTVAGDNTLLVIPASHRRTSAVVTYLKNKLTQGRTA